MSVLRKRMHKYIVADLVPEGLGCSDVLIRNLYRIEIEKKEKIVILFKANETNQSSIQYLFN